MAAQLRHLEHIKQLTETKWFLHKPPLKNLKKPMLSLLQCDYIWDTEDRVHKKVRNKYSSKTCQGSAYDSEESSF